MARVLSFEDQGSITNVHKQAFEKKLEFISVASIASFKNLIKKDLNFNAISVAAYVFDKKSGKLVCTGELIKRFKTLTKGKVPIIGTSDSKDFRTKIKKFGCKRVCKKYEMPKVLFKILGI